MSGTVTRGRGDDRRDGPGGAGSWRLRPVAPADLPQLLALNEAAVPHVNRVDAGQLADQIGWSHLALTAEAADRSAAGPVRPVGLLSAMRPGTPYGSRNYAWFVARYPDFLYVDRIIVGAWAARSGLGRRFYDAVFAEGRRLGVPVCCEVNDRPPNPTSLAFHLAMGLTPVGRRETEDGRAVVFMMSHAAGSG